MQIRSTPFSEESGESSDDDGTSDVEGAPATPRTIARRQQVNQSSSGATKRGMGKMFYIYCVLLMKIDIHVYIMPFWPTVVSNDVH
jgi:hypothetical protein